jgi:hypothetical protein
MVVNFRFISETTFAHGWHNEARDMCFVTAPAQPGILNGEIEMTLSPGSIDGLQFELGKSYSVEFRLLEESHEAEIHQVGSGMATVTAENTGQQPAQAEAA